MNRLRIKKGLKKKLKNKKNLYNKTQKHKERDYNGKHCPKNNVSIALNKILTRLSVYYGQKTLRNKN